MSDFLSLKWGTIKSWDVKSKEASKALARYFDSGDVSMSCMAQRDNDEQRQAIIDTIDLLDSDTVFLEWEEKMVSKEEAKEYVLNYGKE